MTYTPQSDIYLCQMCPLDNRYEHTIKFVSESYQTGYFQSFVTDTISNYKYIKNQNSIDIAINYDNVRAVNYLYYINNTKIVYCFVTSKQYINENTTRFYIETDVMQTYQFDYVLRECFVEREHRDRWCKIAGVYRPYKNITNESVFYGNEYVIKKRVEIIQPTYKVRWLAVFSSEALLESSDEVKPTFNSQVHPFYTYLIPFTDDDTPLFFRQHVVDPPSAGSLGGLTHFSPSQTNKIVGICLLTDFTGNYTVANVNGKRTITSSDLEMIDVFNAYPILRPLNTAYMDTYKNYTINMYTDMSYPLPTNMTKTKLYSSNLESRLMFYPYSHLSITDNVNPPFTFVNDGITSDNYSIKLTQSYSYPVQSHITITGYRGDNNGDIYRLTNNQAQELALMDSTYISYLRSNKNSIATGLAIGAVTGIIGGTIAGGVAGLAAGAVSTFSQIAMQTAKESDIEQIPNTYRNLGSDLYLTIAGGKYSPVLIRWGLSPEYKSSVAKYFYHYGYKVNEYKYPNIESRWRFNFIKTIGCQIQASIDIEDAMKICSIYDNGVTLWHYRDSSFDMFNYMYDNVEVNLL